MQFSKDSIDEFKQIYADDYGVELTDSEAVKLAPKIINLVRIVYLENSNYTN